MMRVKLFRWYRADEKSWRVIIQDPLPANLDFHVYLVNGRANWNVFLWHRGAPLDHDFEILASGSCAFVNEAMRAAEEAYLATLSAHERLRLRRFEAQANARITS